VKLVYLGTPEMAVDPLRALHAAGHEVALVVTGAERRRSRRGRPTPSPVAAAAHELGLPVSHEPDDLVGLGAELGVVVAYGRLLRPHLLAELPMVNLHFSLLPRWRGAAPVQRAILAGDRVTGVCVMRVEEGLDTGCVHERVEVPVAPDATTASLSRELVRVGTAALVEVVGRGLGPCEPQDDHGVTYAAKLGPEDLHLDWSGDAVHLDRQVRVGGAWSTFRGERFKVHQAVPLPEGHGAGSGSPGLVRSEGQRVIVDAGTGSLELVTVQPAGRARMSAWDWCNGAQPVGEHLGGDELG
jgi:methionyl-tRNA formyltransferase